MSRAQNIKNVAVIGAGPAGAICVDALAREETFDTIRVFERREQAGGCWLQDPPGHVQQLPDIEKISNRTADAPIPIPSTLPARTPKSPQYRFSDTSIYDYLETNIDSGAMSFSQERMSGYRTPASIAKHGPNTPFRHWTIVQQYIAGLLDRNGYDKFVSYNTTVELVTKVPETGKWRLTLRKESEEEDYWWSEEFDAVAVASGHYTVPFIPHHDGLKEWAERYPGTVEHSKAFRGPAKYAGKKVVVVGASISGPDVCSNLAGIAASPVTAVVRGKYHPYFFDYAFQNPHIERRPPITQLISADGLRRVVFEDGTVLDDVDHLIFGTGYSWTLHMLPDVEIRNNRVPDLYQHVFKVGEPGLVFIGAVAAGFTFKVFEWQAVLAARYLAGRLELPPIEAQRKWEEDRIALKGDGVPFTALYPQFEEYFETVRELVERADQGPGRKLPRWEKWWEEDFSKAHLLRIEMWKAHNRRAEEELREKAVAS